VHLLGVKSGIVVVTKKDLVDEARLAEVREEIEILTLGTMLEGAPTCEVASKRCATRSRVGRTPSRGCDRTSRSASPSTAPS
jgi:hypothetical protein